MTPELLNSLGILMSVVMSGLALFVTLERQRHQNTLDDNSALKTASEPADLSIAARLNAEKRVLDLEKRIAHLEGLMTGDYLLTAVLTMGEAPRVKDADLKHMETSR